MSKKNEKFTLERNEYHQVTLTYSLEVAVGDQEVWDQLREFALEAGNADENDFPVKASKRVEDWQVLYMKAGDRVKEISVDQGQDWVSESKGTTEYSFSVIDQIGRRVGESITAQ